MSVASKIVEEYFALYARNKYKSSGKDTWTVYKNPTSRDIIDIRKDGATLRIPETEFVKYIVDLKTKTVYAWNGGAAIHDYTFLKLETEEGIRLDTMSSTHAGDIEVIFGDCEIKGSKLVSIGNYTDGPSYLPLTLETIDAFAKSVKWINSYVNLDAAFANTKKELSRW